MAVLGILLAAALLAQEFVLPPARTAIVGASATTTLSGAASSLEQTTRSGSAGFSFTVVSRSTLYAKLDGPKIEIPDPNDRYKTLGLADEYYVNGNIAQGIARPDGFWIQMRDGPASKDAPADFANAPITLAGQTENPR
jgi:hypothetical protein